MPSASRTPSLADCLRKLVRVFEREKVEYMLIGGLALPAYGEIRATQDIDVAIVVADIRILERLIAELGREGFEPTATPQLEASGIYLFDTENAVDVELWQRPDGIRFGAELLSRKRKVELTEKLQAWIIGPEDFIVNKLARTDRRARDESDVVSVLIGWKERLDRVYLERRAAESDVLPLLKALQMRVETIS